MMKRSRGFASIFSETFVRLGGVEPGNHVVYVLEIFEFFNFQRPTSDI